MREQLLRLVDQQNTPQSVPTEASAPAQASTTPALSVADEIRKLGELRDQGLLTPEQFEEQKLKLLG
jgi:hypothetical protein